VIVGNKDVEIYSCDNHSAFVVIYTSKGSYENKEKLDGYLQRDILG